MQEDSDLLTVKEVAKRLKVSEDYVRKRIREKQLRAFDLGGDYRISEVDLQDFLARRDTTRHKED